METTMTGLANGPADPVFWAVIGWAGVIGLTAAVIITRHRANKQNRALEKIRLQQASAEARLADYDAARDALEHERARATNLEQEQAILKTRLEEREKALAELRVRLENDFQAIASKMLNSTHQSFLERANETFHKHEERQKAGASLQQKAVSELITPMKDTLTRYETGLQQMRENQKKAQGELAGQIASLAKSSEQVQAEAARLATALKTGSRTRGRWGEEQLRNVVEMIGMSAYVDFDEQSSVRDGDVLKKPDMVVRLPGERVIAVDAKVSLNAYLDAAEQTDEGARSALLQKHSDEIWAHVQGLARKDYAAALKKQGALDIVVMFIPGENFFAAAMEARPSLLQDAYDKGIVMVTPSSLIALLKTVSFNWRQEKATRNAQEVAELASDLYQAMQRMGSGLDKIGKALDGSVKRYNELVGTVEGSVMPKARKFADYEMPGTEEELQRLEPAEGHVRALRTDRDLIVEDELQGEEPSLLQGENPFQEGAGAQKQLPLAGNR